MRLLSSTSKFRKVVQFISDAASGVGARYLVSTVCRESNVAEKGLEAISASIRFSQRSVILAIDAVISNRVNMVMESTPVDALAAHGARIGALRHANLNTVAEVAKKSESDLTAYSGIGGITAKNVLSSVSAFRSATAANVRVMPDPEARANCDTRLLGALVSYEEIIRTSEPDLRLLYQQHSELENRVNELRKRSKLGAWIFNRDQHDEIRSISNHIRSSLRELASESMRVLTKSKNCSVRPDEAWELYMRNSAPFVAAFERASQFRSANDKSVGSIQGERLKTRAPSLRGGLPSQIADAVEAQVLLPGPLIATLRQYQNFGAQYLIRQQRSLLGDDMGLGKTVQVLAAMCHLHATGKRHFFVVVPKSLLINWEREIQKHTQLTPYIIHGGKRISVLSDWQLNGGVGITTYGTVARLNQQIQCIDMLAVDEAHLVKNPDAMRTQEVEILISKSEFLTLLTGTALENRICELHSLIMMAQPAIKNELKYLVKQAYPCPLEVLSRLAPVYVRRTQDDVLTELPDRVEIDEWIMLTDEDESAYAECPSQIMLKRQAATVGVGDGRSAKYERLRELIESYRNEGRKVLIFSFFKRVLDDACEIVGNCGQITGGMTTARRQQVIDSFSNSRGFAALALQIDTGGVGINLQAAEVVILMEPQFKPSSERQAIARAHRMGQTRKVTVHRLLALQTIDDHLVKLIAKKAKLFEDYAHHSSVKDASEMAIDTNLQDIESELSRMIANER